MSGADVTEFVERQRARRADAGFPPTIVDLDALRLLAAVAASRHLDREVPK